MQTLKWRIVGDKTLVSDIIKFVSRGPVSHAEFILDGPTVDSTAMPNQYTLGARADGGVQIGLVHALYLPACRPAVAQGCLGFGANGGRILHRLRHFACQPTPRCHSLAQ